MESINWVALAGASFAVYFWFKSALIFNTLIFKRQEVRKLQKIYGSLSDNMIELVKGLSEEQRNLLGIALFAGTEINRLLASTMTKEELNRRMDSLNEEDKSLAKLMFRFSLLLERLINQCDHDNAKSKQSVEV